MNIRVVVIHKGPYLQKFSTGHDINADKVQYVKYLKENLVRW